MADASVSARKKNRNTRPWVQIKNALQKRLLKETFQSYEQVENAFSLADINKSWSRISEKLHIKSDDIKARLNDLVHRRNQIVHEGDIVRALRPQKLQYNDVEHEWVVDAVNWIDNLVGAFEQVVADETQA